MMTTTPTTVGKLVPDVNPAATIAAPIPAMTTAATRFNSALLIGSEVAGQPEVG